MVQKRPFYDEDACGFTSKHPRQLEHCDRLVLFSELPPEVTSMSPNTTGDGYRTLTEKTIEGLQGFESAVITKHPVSSEGEETATPCSVYASSFLASCSSEEASPSGTPHELCSPQEHFSPANSMQPISCYEDIYSVLLKCPPQRAVPIGSNHQADIPEWESSSREVILEYSDLSEVFLDGSHNGYKDERFVGNCVIPMPTLECPEEIGNTKPDCNCLDKGSVRCVRQHIMEARERIRRDFGLKKFVDLGFCEMGEQVAEKWTAEEEQLFYQVIFFNPISSGGNFWDHLSYVFPSRTRKDIVSYYFNVFILHRRAEQNRCDALEIDSDYDDCQDDGNYDDRDWNRGR